MSKLKLFQYAILFHPNEKERKDGEKTKLLVEPKTILTTDQQSAGMEAVMDIPADYKGKLDQIEIALHPF